MDFSELKGLIQVIEELRVDISLFWNNVQRAIRLDFTELVDVEAGEVVESVLTTLFSNTPFWVCAYGSDSSRVFYKNRLFLSRPKVFVIPCHFECNEWFEYDHDAIACVYTPLELFSASKYASYVFRSEFQSNTMFLVDPTRNIALYAYDRRGMDIVTTDDEVLKMLIQNYRPYLMEKPKRFKP